MKTRLMIATQTVLLAGGMSVAGGVSASDTAHAAKSCGFGWAKPGRYKVSGNFRGRVEATSARLTSDCRVSLQFPGVFSGGRVKKSGKCLRFALKVEGQRKVFFAKWCNTYGVVPWQGRNIRAEIKPISIETPSVRVKTNFNN
ncbi:MAG: hypothetical protein HKP56_14785 [Anderseniella sp.]|nr:hypothetical protein [Anderseniella sp.]